MNHNAQSEVTEQNAALRLSRNPNKAMQEMMETIDHIRTVYERETDVLAQSDMQGFMALQNEKFEAAQAYQQGVEQMLARKAEMKAADPALKDRLEDMQKDFAHTTQKNLDALERMKNAMDGLGSKIRMAAKEEAHKQRAFSYGESGHIQKDENKAISTGIIETA